MKLTPNLLALYLGSRFVLRFRDNNELSTPMQFGVHAYAAATVPVSHPDHITPLLILRKLEDMTEEEADKLASMCPQRNYDKYNPAQFTYLLSKSFDLFGLIEAGLAIDAKTLNSNSYERNN